MARNDEQTNEKVQTATGTTPPEATAEQVPQDDSPSLFQKLKEETREADEKPSGTLRLRDILGGDHLITLVRNQLGLIVLIVAITTVYVAFRYQCQQDTIDINQLEREVTDAKYKALSSTSKLTELSRLSNVLQVLRQHNDTLLQPSKQPPFNIFVPEISKKE